jgi:uncharacterized phage protein (TIGR02218 family)
MKTSTPALRALLASRQFASADLFTFTLIGGQVMRYCSGDRDITANGHVFSAGGQTGPYVKNIGRVHWTIGTKVDDMTFDVLAGAGTVMGLPFVTACKIGTFDGAECQRDKAIMPTYGDTSAGTVVMFVGRVGDLAIGQAAVNFTINAHTELLNQNFPRNLIQPGCLNTLYGAACTLNQTAFAINGVVLAGSTTTSWLANIAQANKYFDLGKILFTSGQNSGFARSIKSWTAPNLGNAGIAALTAPSPFVPAAGDTFTIYPGCDKTQPTCTAKFNNLANFRAFPFVPAPETAL